MSCPAVSTLLPRTPTHQRVDDEGSSNMRYHRMGSDVSLFSTGAGHGDESYRRSYRRRSSSCKSIAPDPSHSAPLLQNLRVHFIRAFRSSTGEEETKTHSHSTGPEASQSPSGRRRSWFRRTKKTASREQMYYLMRVQKLSSVRYSEDQSSNNAAIERSVEKSWEIRKSFEEFFEFKKTLLHLADYGHSCHASCPWLWAYVSNEFPRKRWFRPHRDRVVMQRLLDLQGFMNTLLQALSAAGRSQETKCITLTVILPSVVHTFLHPDEPERSSTRCNQRSSLSSLSDSSTCSLEDDLNDLSMSLEYFTCICGEVLERREAMAGSNLEPSKCTSHSITDYSSITTLQCGHQFHDHCIVRALDKCMGCPICHSTPQSTR